MTVQFGPRDDLKFPLKSMGMIFYEKLSKYDHNKMFLVSIQFFSTGGLVELMYVLCRLTVVPIQKSVTNNS
jgi:hypothetical protein